MAKNTKNAAAESQGLEIGLSEFPAYWEPVEGASFTAYPMAVDRRDPEFERIVFKATHDVECFKGPKSDQEDVTVAEGEVFTVSLYKVFQGAIEEQIMMGLLENIPLTVTAIEKATQAGDKKKTYWKFSVQVPPAYITDYKQRVLSYSQAKRLASKTATVEG